jgi:hypothetical protein
MVIAEKRHYNIITAVWIDTGIFYSMKNNSDMSWQSVLDTTLKDYVK